MKKRNDNLYIIRGYTRGYRQAIKDIINVVEALKILVECMETSDSTIDIPEHHGIIKGIQMVIDKLKEK